jgi:hypothetical protein
MRFIEVHRKAPHGQVVEKVGPDPNGGLLIIPALGETPPT